MAAAGVYSWQVIGSASLSHSPSYCISGDWSSMRTKQFAEQAEIHATSCRLPQGTCRATPSFLTHSGPWVARRGNGMRPVQLSSASVATSGRNAHAIFMLYLTDSLLSEAAQGCMISVAPTGEPITTHPATGDHRSAQGYRPPVRGGTAGDSCFSVRGPHPSYLTLSTAFARFSMPAGSSRASAPGPGETIRCCAPAST